MKWRLLGFSAFFVLFLLLRAPAACWDVLLRNVSRDTLALSQASGTIWQGEAELAVREPTSGRLRPLMPLAWSWQPTKIFGGHIAWDFSLAGSQAFSLAAGIRSITTSNISLNLPARSALERIPNVLGRAGWHGDLQLTIPRWTCSYQKICEGLASLAWTGAAVDIFPGRKLGDYQLDANARNGLIDFQIATRSGEIQVSTRGQWRPDQSFQVSGSLSGEPAFVSRLPNIAGRWVQATRDPGRFEFRVALP